MDGPMQTDRRVSRGFPASCFTARDSLAGAGRDPGETSSCQPRLTRLTARNLEGNGDGCAAPFSRASSEERVSARALRSGREPRRWAS